jgi:hypothetical protein
MEFTRKKKRGMDRRVMKIWLSEDKQYKIVWTCECMGVPIRPHFHALVYVVAGERRAWGFAGRTGPYRKLKAAIEACEKHQKIWQAALDISKGEYKGRADRLRALDGRARAGSGVTRARLLMSLPEWVLRQAPPNLLATLYGSKKCKSNDQDDQPEASTTSESYSLEELEADETPMTVTGGPASSAPVEEKSETNETETSSKATNSRRGTHAPRAKGRAPGRKKQSKRSTTKQSASTKSNESSTTKPSKQGGRRSKS